MRLSEEKLQRFVGNMRIVYFEQTDSTNTQARKIIFQDDAPFLVLAERQAAGRGRMGRHFQSDGNGVYMSFAFKSSSPQSSVSVTTAAAAAVVSALGAACEGDYKIKWVNDVIHNGKKVCGILTEGVSCGDEHYFIVGIGINVGENKFCGELEGIAGSVTLKSSPEELVALIVKELLHFASNPKDREYMKLYREKFCLYNTSVNAMLDGASISGVVQGVTDDGALVLLVDGEDTPRIILSGEVSIRLKNN